MQSNDGSDTSPRERVWTYILNSASSQGCWNLDDYEEWAPITTALIVDLLLHCGVGLDEQWIAGADGNAFRVSIRDSLTWLDANIRTDGSFGEDLWDAVRFARTIITFKLRGELPSALRLLDYVDREIAGSSHTQYEQTWDGPGVLAAITSYLIAIGNRDHAADLIAELSRQQMDSGEFRGTVAADGNDLASPVWHTSQVLTTFCEFGVHQKDERVNRMIAWLRRTQSNAGNWPGFSRYDIYYTAYAVTALSALSAPPQPTLERAVSWLKSIVSASGKVRDVGGTVMTCVALCRVEGFVIGGTFEGVAYHNFSRLRDDLRATGKELELERVKAAALEAELAAFQRKFGTADFGVTQAQAFLWGLASIIVGVALSVIPVLLNRK